MDLKKLMKQDESKQDFEVSIGHLLTELSKVNDPLAQAVHNVICDALSVMVERNVKQKYKESFAVAGLHGALFQIMHKGERLKNSLIDDETMGFSLPGVEILKASVKDGKLDKDKGPYAHVIDDFNYCLLTMTLFHRYLDGQNKSE